MREEFSFPTTKRKAFFASLLLLFLLTSLFQLKQESLSYSSSLNSLESKKLISDNLAFLRFQLEINIDSIIFSNLSSSLPPNQIKQNTINQIKNEISYFQSQYPTVQFSYTPKKLNNSKVYLLNKKSHSELIFSIPEDFTIYLKSQNIETQFKLPKNYSQKVILPAQ